jgi:hypothetical protein
MEETDLSNNILSADQSASLTEVREFENLRMSTVDICHAAGIDTLHELLNYNNLNADFSGLRTYDTRVNSELKKICEKFSDPAVRDYFDKRCLENRQRKEFILDNIKDIELHLLADIENMSVRCFNVCIAADLMSLKKIISFYFDNKRHEFAHIRNSGKDTNKALVDICRKYEEVANAIHLIKTDATNPILPVYLFFGFVNLPVEDYKNTIIHKDGVDNILLFGLLDKMIDDYHIFPQERNLRVFKATLNCYNSSGKMKLKEIGELLELTEERGRQIRVNIYYKFQRAFGFIRFGSTLNVFPEYIKPTGQPVIFVTDEQAKTINETEHTNFTPLFISFIFSKHFSDDFITLGDMKTLFSNAIFRKKTYIRHLYLVNRKVASQFKFNDCLHYIELLVSRGRKVDKFIPYSSLIEKFKGSAEPDYNSIVEVINTIIIHDFSTYFEIKEEGLSPLKSKYRPIITYIIEILEESKKPLHFKVIYEKLVKQGVDTKNDESVLYFLNSNKDIFGQKGRGVYDLRSKGGFFGTVCDVAEQILRVRKKPVSITSLERLIYKELNVFKQSVRPMLFSYDKKKRFIKLPGHFVGLSEWGPLSPPYRKLKY